MAEWLKLLKSGGVYGRVVGVLKIRELLWMSGHSQNQEEFMAKWSESLKSGGVRGRMARVIDFQFLASHY